MTPQQTELMIQWHAARAELAAAKLIVEKEMELRKLVVASFFPEAKEGTNNADLGDGWKLKFTNNFEYKLDEAVMDNIRWQLTEAGFSPDRVFSYTPKIMLKEYRGLPDNIKPIVDSALTIKPKSPTLELVAPK